LGGENKGRGGETQIAKATTNGEPKRSPAQPCVDRHAGPGEIAQYR